jgi:hypothetical protein
MLIWCRTMDVAEAVRRKERRAKTYAGEVIYSFSDGGRWVCVRERLMTYVRPELIVREVEAKFLPAALVGYDEKMSKLSLASATRVMALDLPLFLRERLVQACMYHYFDEEPRGYAVLDLLRLNGADLEATFQRIGPTRLIHINRALAEIGCCLNDY